MADSKAITFRVRRIPSTIVKSRLSRYLASSFDADANAPPVEITVRSLAPSPDDWDLKPSQTATIEFSRIPQRLREKQRSQWTISHAITKRQLLIDRDFLGFTPLKNVDSKNHTHEYVSA